MMTALALTPTAAPIIAHAITRLAHAAITEVVFSLGVLIPMPAIMIHTRAVILGNAHMNLGVQILMLAIMMYTPASKMVAALMAGVARISMRAITT